MMNLLDNVSSLVEILKSATDESVRASAALALGDVDEESVIPALCLALSTDASPEVRRSAAKALGMLGSKKRKEG